MVKPSKIIKSRRKNISLMIDKQGDLIIKAPTFVTNRELYDLVERKQDWVLKKQREVLEQVKARQFSLVEGAKLMFQGEDVTIHIGDFPKIRIKEGQLYLPSNPKTERMERALCDWMKQQAAYLIEESLSHYSDVIGVEYEEYKLSNARTRWGTCNSNHILRFSWRLVMCPQDILDYVVVHELCHIGCMNHSKAFWERVGRALPDYKQRRKWLRTHQAIMDFM
ncbi:MAG: M48 family metallopeptidase [Clostridia bacterium]|nr:M48 family metallopeptidase [Clostridia bacterium]